MADAVDPAAIEAVIFDSYGTLVDTGAAARVLEDVVDDPEAVARAWRENALFFSVVADQLDAYDTYLALHCDGLADALAAAGYDLPDDQIRELNQVYHDLDAYDDVASGFERLYAAGYAPSILSNGTPAMLASLVETAGIGSSVAELVSADELRTFKPAAELYEHAAARLDTALDRVTHVTAHWMDIQGANNAGLQGIWLNRADDAWTAFGGEPALVVASIDELCTRLDA